MFIAIWLIQIEVKKYKFNNVITSNRMNVLNQLVHLLQILFLSPAPPSEHKMEESSS